MKYKTLILALISILVLSLNAEASNKKIKVLFLIPPSADTALRSETKSYITRELREFKDVELYTDNDKLDNIADYFLISIVPVELRLSNGVTSGYAVSYVIDKNDTMEHNVLIGGPNDLKVLCKKVIAYFDTYWLERERKKQK
jgi:hypothetical protein